MLDLLLITLTDKTPEPEDVKAGWTALIIFLLLALAVAGLGWSLVRQLRKAQSAKDLGLYGDEPVDREAEARARAEMDAAERDEPTR
ncbi:MULTISPECIES: hypothetical protein [Nocardioides]|jgi:membrane protein implicated in regulation of membrane protease activity|uniref:hypothetical protein n=1 Tax=Nocardioides TaxID=1839 RepID=UPI000702B283|nr:MULTISPECIES: hypothetical protein [Nocardioides]KRF06469.1 hypothetical protein ASG88_20200 [Nocardioides sp. Soil777]